MKNIDDDGKISKDSNQYARLWRLSRIRLAECSDDNSRNLRKSTFLNVFENLVFPFFPSKINEIEIEYYNSTYLQHVWVQNSKMNAKYNIYFKTFREQIS